jgi:hypothetical protein
MKRSITFSVENNIADDFLEETGDKKNFVIERIMFDYLASRKEVPTIKCKTCGAIYSEKLLTCPQCKLNENLLTAATEHQLSIQQMKNRLAMLERVRPSGGSTDEEINNLREKIKKEEEI